MGTYYKYREARFTLTNSYPLTMNGFPPGGTCGNFVAVPQPKASKTITNDGKATVVLRGTPQWEHPALLNADYFTGEVPASKETTNVSYVIRQPRSAKAFNELKADGTIVLTPYERCTITSRRVPGAKPSGPVVNFAQRSATLQIAFEKNFENLPCIPPAWGYKQVAVGGVPMDVTVLAASPNQSTAINRYWDRFEVDQLQLPPDIANSLSQLLLSEIQKKEWDTGLITSTIAQANSGIYDLLTELAEAKETVSFIIGALGNLARIIVRTKRDLVRLNTNRKANPRFDEDLAGLWLEFRYAVQPIGYSVNSAIDLVNASFSKYQTVRQGVSYETEPVELNGWTIPSLKIIDRCFAKYRFSGDTTLHNIKFDPFATAWELFPLSFVIDWFFNVGDVVSSLSVPSNVSQQAMSYSRQLVKTPFSMYHPESPGHIQMTAAYYSYVPFSPLSQIGFDLSLDMTWKRWLDAIALSWLSIKRSI